jgi:hypothetical protein
VLSAGSLCLQIAKRRATSQRKLRQLVQVQVLQRIRTIDLGTLYIECTHLLPITLKAYIVLIPVIEVLDERMQG